MAQRGRAAGVLVATVVALAAAAAPAPARKLPPVPPKLESLLPPGPAGTRASPGPSAPALLTGEPRARDAIVAGGSSSIRGVSPSGAGGFKTSDGYTIIVRWADSGPYGPADAQVMVDFLGSLLHGNEMRALSVYLATESELSQICGGDALACYSALEEEMIISGDPASSGGLTRKFIVAHEYGHHVANNRNNAPFPAMLFGPKYWATQQRICPGVVSGRYQPLGDYYRRPGEAFAEAFAFNRFPNDTSWDWRFPHPNAASYLALRRDTNRPWRKRVRGKVVRRLDGRDRIDAFRVRTPLDGRLTLKLRAHRRADFDLYVLARKKLVLLARRAGAARIKRVNLLICGRPAVRVVVVASHGAGRYTLKAARP